MTNYEVRFVGPGADVTDRQITAKQFEAIGVKASRDLRWKPARDVVPPETNVELLENPDQTLLDYLKGDSDFKVSEVKEDAPAEPAPKSKS